MASVAHALLLATSVVACRGPCGRERFSRTAATADARSGPWRHATVTVHFAPTYHGVNSSRRASVTHSIELSGAAPSKTIALDANLTPSRGTCEPSFALSFSPDGAMLALSRDGHRSWEYLGLGGPDLLFCHHQRPSVAADPWRAAPSTRSLALGLLRASLDVTTARQHTHSDFGWRWGSELAAAARYACTNAQDADVRAALSGVLAHIVTWRAYGMQNDPLGPALLCMAGVAQRDATFAAEMRGGLSTLARDRSGRAFLTRFAEGCERLAYGAAHPFWCMARDAIASTTAP